jgi:hypothetical protein
MLRPVSGTDKLRMGVVVSFEQQADGTVKPTLAPMPPDSPRGVLLSFERQDDGTVKPTVAAMPMDSPLGYFFRLRARNVYGCQLGDDLSGPFYVHPADQCEGCARATSWRKRQRTTGERSQP